MATPSLVYNTLCILPCTSEIRKAHYFNMDRENMEGRQKMMRSKIDLLSPTSPINCFRRNQQDEWKCSYGHALRFLTPPPRSCESVFDFWTMFLTSTLNMLPQDSFLPNPTHVYAVLATHQNRMKKTILPIPSSYGYANCSCFAIHFQKNKQLSQIDVQVIFGGFPDSKKYTFVQNTTLLKRLLPRDLYHKWASILNRMELNYLNLSVLVFRHGNAMHNKPMAKPRILDSPLTLLGIWQAQQLGTLLRDRIFSRQNYSRRLLLMASPLRRAQQTCLLAMKRVCQLPPTLLSLLDYYNWFSLKMTDSVICIESQPHWFQTKSNIHPDKLQNVLDEISKDYLQCISSMTFTVSIPQWIPWVLPASIEGVHLPRHQSFCNRRPRSCEKYHLTFT